MCIRDSILSLSSKPINYDIKREKSASLLRSIAINETSSIVESIDALLRNINNNENIHLVIKAGSWFSMKSKGKYSLIGCTVSPGFNYSDFELAPKNWEPG